MKILNSQDTIVIEHPSNIKRIGIKMSGGADSSIVAFMLAKYVAEERPDIELIPITVVQQGKSYQQQFSSRVIDFIEQTFKIKFGFHYTDISNELSLNVTTQQNLVSRLYDQDIIDIHYVGITQNPPIDIAESFGDFNLPTDDRSSSSRKPTVSSDGRVFLPLRNINKQGVAELYNFFNVTDTLFPLTRSCEQFTDDFRFHCKTNCWFCAERFWGFARYE